MEGTVGAQVWRLEARRSTSQPRRGAGRARSQWVDCVARAERGGGALAVEAAELGTASPDEEFSGRSLSAPWEVVRSKKLVRCLSSKVAANLSLADCGAADGAEKHEFPLSSFCFCFIEAAFPYEYIASRVFTIYEDTKMHR